MNIRFDLDPYSACRTGLFNLWKTSPKAFQSLFHQGQISTKDLDLDLAPFVELGLVQLDGSVARASVAITAYNSLFIATDFISYTAVDRVFPAYSDESFLLGMWPDIRSNDVVLDIGTGSGVIAILAEKRGAKYVVASDITERSNQFFDMNVKLNGCRNIEFVKSDALDAVPDYPYTLALCNPPFAPVPPQSNYFIHSDGGPFGTAVLEKVLQQTATRMPRTRLYAMSMSLGSGKSWRVGELHSKYGEEPFEYTPIYEQNVSMLNAYVKSLPSALQDSEWMRSLQKSHGYDRIGYFALMCRETSIDHTRLQSAVASLIKHAPFSPLNSYSWSMHDRLRRYNAHAAAT